MVIMLLSSVRIILDLRFLTRLPRREGIIFLNSLGGMGNESGKATIYTIVEEGCLSPFPVFLHPTLLSKGEGIVSIFLFF